MRYLGITDLGGPRTDQDVDAPIRLCRLSLVAAALGILAGFIDFGLTELIRLITNLGYHQSWSFTERMPGLNNPGWWAVLLPAAGGLTVGLMEKYGSPKIRGGGIAPAQAHALAGEAGAPARIAWLKPFSAAVAIGAGSPLGREGPTIQSADMAGSFVAPWLGLSDAERRLLTGCAAAAGMAATYRTAAAGVLLGVEVILFKIRSRALVPLIAAAASASAVGFLMLDPDMLVRVPPIRDAGLPGALPSYAVFGAACGLLGAALCHGLDGVRALFRRWPIGTPWNQAIAGFGVGLIGLALPLVLGSGYSIDSRILDGSIEVSTLALLAPLKFLAFLIAFGGGMSGGMFSPAFMTGAAAGALFAHGMNALLPGLGLDPARVRAGRRGGGLRVGIARPAHLHRAYIRTRGKQPGACASGAGQSGRRRGRVTSTEIPGPGPPPSPAAAVGGHFTACGLCGVPPAVRRCASRRRGLWARRSGGRRVTVEGTACP